MKEYKKAPASTAVAKTNDTSAVSTPVDYGSEAGAGFENQSREDVSIPFLNVLQSNSPQITDNEAARPGMLYNSITEELVKGTDGVVFVPATTTHVYVEWKPRTAGGGFVGIHKIDSDVVKRAKAKSTEFGKYKTDAGNDLTETFSIYGIMLDAQEQPTGFAVLGFSSTKIGAYKRWNTKVSMFTVPAPGGGKVRPPLFAHKVRITTVKDSNPKGDFFNVDLQPANGSVVASLLPPGHPALLAAKELRDMVNTGVATANHADAPSSPQAAAAEASPDWQA